MHNSPRLDRFTENTLKIHQEYSKRALTIRQGIYNQMRKKGPEAVYTILPIEVRLEIYKILLFRLETNDAYSFRMFIGLCPVIIDEFFIIRPLNLLRLKEILPEYFNNTKYPERHPSQIMFDHQLFLEEGRLERIEALKKSIKEVNKKLTNDSNSK